jgi:hypothetical protein
MKLQLSFHTTFALRKSEVARVLALGSRAEGLPASVEEFMAETGFGTKKVGPVKSWTTRGGLLDGNTASQEGKLIFELDPWLRSSTTEWFMHCNLAFGSHGFASLPTTPSEWGAWTYFVFEFMPDRNEFTLEGLARVAESVFEDSPKLLKANFPYLLRAYTDPDGLSSCGYVRTAPDGGFRRGGGRPNVALCAYVLTRLWERDFGPTESVLTEALLEQQMGLGNLFGISHSDVQSLLDEMSARGLIEQRRTVAPHQVVRRWRDGLSLLREAYS